MNNDHYNINEDNNAELTKNETIPPNDKKHFLKNKLTKTIIIEYSLIFLTLIIVDFLLPLIIVQPGFQKLEESGNTGIDSIGQALGIIIIFRLIKYITVFIFFVIIPIVFLVIRRKELKNITLKWKKILCIIIMILPILLSALIIFENRISDYQYYLEYETSPTSYTIDKTQYKSANDFRNELETRELLFTEKATPLLNQLNEKYHSDTTNTQRKYYGKALLTTLSTDTFYNYIEESDAINFNTSQKAPVYIYNAILTLPNKNSNLQYAPISLNYDFQLQFISKPNPYGNDYYIECKILYVDGDIYALIGLATSFNIYTSFSQHNIDGNLPYEMILSEKDTITTFSHEQYHPNGAIENKGRSSFEMQANEKQVTTFFENYPIHKVDKLDLNTINEIASELQNDVLSESIKNYFNEQ